MENPKILIDFEKSLDPYSGLGQFALFLKSHFDQSSMNINYFIPRHKKLLKLFPFLLPACDVFHAIHQDCPYIPWSKKTKYIITIHDFNAIYEFKSEKKKNRFLKTLQKKVNRADHIVLISEFTRDEAFKYLKIEDKKISVIYNGISLPTISQRPNHIPKYPFLFTIGTVVPKKNFKVLIPMMKHLENFELIIAGTTFHPYAKELMSMIEELQLLDRIKLVETISNEEKSWYYENAKAFVFPSLLEGFGLPVAEAMSLGLPLFLSNKTSLPEIGGPDAFYFNDFNPEKMAKLIELELGNFNDEKKNKLMTRSKKFDWKNAADKYLSIYREGL